MSLTLLAFDRDAAPGDLQFLTDENIAEIGAHSVKDVSQTLPKPAVAARVDRERDVPHREDAAACSPEGLERCVQPVISGGHSKAPDSPLLQQTERQGRSENFGNAKF